MSTSFWGTALLGGLMAMTAGCHQPRHNRAATIQALWDYGDARGSEARLRDALSTAREAGDRAYSIELMTQVARAQGLQRQFDDANATLDDVDAQLSHLGASNDIAAAMVRLLLERGRVLNSSGSPDKALPLFVRAWEHPRDGELDGLAVDAAHMIAIVDGPNALAWNEKALAVAESSPEPDAQRWRGSLHNNIGWTHHGRGSYETALEHFEAALVCRVEQGKPDDIRTAQWCIARCLRSLDRLDEALKMQRDLEASQTDADQPDGYVFEEIAECLHALGRIDESPPYFRRAYEILSQDAWLAEAEPERIERLRQMGS